MRPQRRCRYCHAIFDARNRRQKACLKPTCQKQRRRNTNRANYRTHRHDRDYIWDKRKAWWKKKGCDYMRTYRKENPNYVKENRCQQKERNRRRRKKIVKSDLRKPLQAGNLIRIHILEKDCKVRLVRLLPL